MDRAGRVGLYVAFLASGVSALIYQVVWSRYLTLLVGGTSVAYTIVLATFMAGLACGNVFFGRRADGPRVNRLRLYALLELGIGLYCLLFPLLFARLADLYLALARIGGPGARVNGVLKVGLSALSMFVPCALMGGTLPVLARYVVDRLGNLGVKLSWLYFVNTAGAVLGCLLGGFWVVESFGLETGMIAGAVMNLLIGLAFYLASGRVGAGATIESGAAPEGAPGPEAADEPVYTARQAEAAFWCIAVAGAVSMLYELCWTRVLTLSMGSSVHSFSTMLLSFISGIALGSAIVARLMRRPRNALMLFAACEVGVSLSILVPLQGYQRLPYLFHRVGSFLDHSLAAYPLYLAGQVLTAALVMLVPTTLIGAALPLASRVCVERVEVVGRRVGGVFSANTIGTVIGAASTGFLLLPSLGVQWTLRLGCFVSAVLGLVLLHAANPDPWPLRRSAPPRARGLWVPVAALVVVVMGAGMLRPGWDPRVMQAGLFRWGTSLRFEDWGRFRDWATHGRFLYARDGMDATVAVHEQGPLLRNLRVNGKVDASVDDMATQLMVGHLPMFLHPHPQRAMVVGLGSGASAAAVLRHPGVTVDVAEISPEMVEAARFFEPWNDAVLENPRLSLYVIDAREFLLLTDRRYDVIVSEPTNVWVPGVANLFTRDFYQVVKSRLQPGGLFAQWIQVYSVEPEMVASVVATLRSQFPYVSAWLVGQRDLILLAGQQRPPFEPGRLAERMAAVKGAEGLPSPPKAQLGLFLHPLLFLAHQLGTSEGMEMAWPAPLSPVYRDLRPRLEFQAARAQFVGQSFKVGDQLDERLSHLGTEPLFIEEYLARYPLDDHGRVVLASLLGGLPEFSPEVRTAVSAGPVAGSAAPAESWKELPQPVLANMLLAARLGLDIDRGAATAEACEVYLEAETALVRASRSVFGLRPLDGLRGRAARCLAANPGRSAEIGSRTAEALAAGGDLEALAWLGRLEQQGALSRLPPADAARVVASASVLLLQKGRRPEALTLAQRAFALDPHNAFAIRIVWAFAAAQAAAGRPAGSPPS